MCICIRCYFCVSLISLLFLFHFISCRCFILCDDPWYEHQTCDDGNVNVFADYFRTGTIINSHALTHPNILPMFEYIRCLANWTIYGCTKLLTQQLYLVFAVNADNPSDSAVSKLYNPSGVDVSYSTRHVEESWHHLMKSEDTAKFKQIAVCNFDFLLAAVSMNFAFDLWVFTIQH